VAISCFHFLSYVSGVPEKANKVACKCLNVEDKLTLLKLLLDASASCWKSVSGSRLLAVH
jgi:hypothetical protein